MTRPFRAVLPAFAGLLGITPALAQTELVGTGDVVAGLGTVSGVHVAAVDAAGSWVARVALSGPGAPPLAVLRDGAALLVGGAPLPGLAGGTLDELVWPTLNGADELAWTADASLPAFMSPVQVLGFEGAVVRGFGDALLPAGLPGFGPGTYYVGFESPALNDQRRLLVRAVLEDPGAPGFGAAALLRLDLDQGGAVTGETLLAAAGDALGGGTVTDLATNGRLAWNDLGEALWWARVTPAKEVLVRDGVALVATGDASPLGGPWLAFHDGLAHDDAGDVAFVGSAQGATGPQVVVVRNGAIVVREGGPVTPSGTFVSFDGERLEMADDGSLVFAGSWQDDGLHSGIFVDDRPVVRFGATQIGAQVVAGLAAGLGGGVRVRPDGAISAALALSDGTVGDFVLVVDGALSAVPGCFGNAGTLTVTGMPAVEHALAFALDQARRAVSPSTSPSRRSRRRPDRAGSSSRAWGRSSSRPSRRTPPRCSGAARRGRARLSCSGSRCRCRSTAPRWLRRECSPTSRALRRGSRSG